MDVQEQREVWECNNCKHVVHKEEEVICWECGQGEMTYQGKFWFDAIPLPYPYTLLERLRFKPWQDSRPRDDLLLNTLRLLFWIGVCGTAVVILDWCMWNCWWIGHHI